MYRVSIELGSEGDRLESKFHNSSNTTTEGHYPSTATGSFPVRRKCRLPGEVPALLQVVIDEVLQQELIHIGTATRSPPTIRC